MNEQTLHSRVLCALAALALLGVSCSGPEDRADIPGPEPSATVPLPEAGPERSLASVEPACEPAAGLRQHPFVAVGADATPVAGPAASPGALKLTGTIGGAERVAIVEDGEQTLVVREGDTVAGLEVRTIGRNEVLLGSETECRTLAIQEAGRDARVRWRTR